VVDNGHTVQVTVGTGNYLTVSNRTYELVQFHFHRPSEERINGKSFVMVVHLVHKDVEGKLAIVALLLERGKPQSTIQTVWNNLPLEKGQVVAPSIVLDVAEMLPQRRDYYTYMGSITEPPCTEGVLWMVMKEPVQASAGQMALFSRLYPLNARPTQASSGRMIKESN
jgi:carbonic anhydrase